MESKGLGSAILILALLAALALSAQALSAEDGPQTAVTEEPEPEPEPIEHLDGYVYDIPELKEREVIAGVTVTTWVSNDREFGSAVTNEDGWFQVDYNSEVKYISFKLTGYTIKGWCSELTKTGDTGLYTINLKDSSQQDGVHHLYDSSGYTVLISRTDATVYGNVSTLINTTPVGVPNANVSLSYAGTTISGVTDAYGNFTIVCASGQSYKLTVSANGFYTQTIDDVTPGAGSIELVMVQKDHTLFMDLDLAHALALLGMFITLILAVVAVYLIKRPEKQDGLFVVNDIPPLKKKKE